MIERKTHRQTKITVTIQGEGHTRETGRQTNAVYAEIGKLTNKITEKTEARGTHNIKEQTREYRERGNDRHRQSQQDRGNDVTYKV